jgi:hypothetical protein
LLEALRRTGRVYIYRHVGVELFLQDSPKTRRPFEQLPAEHLVKSLTSASINLCTFDLCTPTRSFSPRVVHAVIRVHVSSFAQLNSQALKQWENSILQYLRMHTVSSSSSSITYLPHLDLTGVRLHPPGRTDKDLCRCFGAPARRVFPDHLIITTP